MRLDEDWYGRVRAWCDPVFDAAEWGFVASAHNEALLWEADPAKFAARYPESRVIEAYGGDLADVHCIDFWIYMDRPGYARLSPDGWDLPELHVPLLGWAEADGRSLAAVIGRILGVAVAEPPPG
jgi:hypothetical protein